MSIITTRTNSQDILEVNMKIKKIDIALLIGFVIAIVAGNFSAFANNCDDIRSSVVRLHILANSDSEEDQQLKLMVRDRLLSSADEIFGNADSIEIAEANVDANLRKIEEISMEVIDENGSDYEVRAELTNMYFTTRVYDNITMPAGYYDALRITIGEAKGRNWWCVLYPPLCLPAATAENPPNEEVGGANTHDYFTNEQSDIIEKSTEYEVKFAVVEVVESVKNFFKGLFS